MDYVDQIEQFTNPERKLNTLSTDEIKTLIGMLDRPMWESIMDDPQFVPNGPRRFEIIEALGVEDYEGGICEFNQLIKEHNVPPVVYTLEEKIIGAIRGDFYWYKYSDTPEEDGTFDYVLPTVILMDCFHEYYLNEMTIEEVLTANFLGIKRSIF